MTNEPELVELARSLQHDPKLIFEYVHNNIDYEPYFGYKKGPVATLQELAGNDFDQASLLVQLLRISGYQAEYLYGALSIPVSGSEGQLSARSWLSIYNVDYSGVPPAELQGAIARALYNAGIPYNFSGSSAIRVARVWVRATINSVSYRMDPAFKVYKQKRSQDFRQGMGFVNGEILTTAAGTKTTNSIRNLNDTAVRNRLTDYTTNLVAYLNSNYPNTKIEDLLGSKELIPEYYSQLSAMFSPRTQEVPLSPNDNVLPTLVPWEEIPPEYIHTVNIKHGGIDQAFNLPDIAKKKLSISYQAQTTAAKTGTEYCPEVAISSINSPITIDVGPVNGWVELCIKLPVQIVGYYRTLTTSTPGIQFSPNPGTYIGSCTNWSSSFYSIGSDRRISFGFFDTTADGVLPNQNYSVSFNAAFKTNISGFATCPTQLHPITFNVTATSVLAQLKLDDIVIDQHTISGYGGYRDIRVSYDAPYAANNGTYADYTRNSKILVGGEHVIVVENGKRFDKSFEKRKEQLNRFIKTNDARALSEALYVTGLNYILESGLTKRLANSLTNSPDITEFFIGIFSQEDTYKMDIILHQGAPALSEDGWIKGELGQKAFNRLLGLLGSGYEHGVFEQLQGSDVPAVSTIKWLYQANQQGNYIYRLTQSNFNSIKPSLSGYSDANLASIQALLNSNHILFLPQKGDMQLLQAKGFGYIEEYPNSDSYGMMLNSGLNGGGGTVPNYNPEMCEANAPSEFDLSYGLDSIIPNFSADPVNMYTGSFYYQNTDLVLGAAEPNGLRVARSYQSDNVLNESALSHGWSHNYDIRLKTTSEPGASLGNARAIDAAPMIVTMYAMLDIMQVDKPGLSEWMSGVLVSKWAMDQIQDNTRVLSLSGKQHMFTRMPNGTYNSPIGTKIQLINEAGLYRLQDDKGTNIRFNADNQISTWRDADDNEMSFTYASGKLRTVRDAFGRTLTYNYFGDLLDNITDSAGRVVRYGYNPQTQELINYIDVDQHTWQYGYDVTRTDRGYINSITNPESKLLVTNYYNDLNQVTRQVMPRQSGARPYQSASAEYQLFFNGFRNIEKMQTGAQHVYFYDKRGRNIGEQDAVGNRVSKEYDGQNNVINTIAPNGVQTRYQYNAAGQPEKIIDANTNEVSNAYNTNGDLVSTTNALGYQTQYKYDNEHHQTQKIDAENNYSSFDYYANGQLKTAIDPKSATTLTTYDAGGYPQSIKTGSLPAVQYSYDSMGRMASITDTVNNITRYDYTNSGAIKTVTDPFGRTTVTSYWNDGNVKSVTDRNKNTVNMTYTPSGKLAVATYPDASHINYYYDSHDRLREIQQSQGSSLFEYDLNDRVTQFTDINGFITGYTYTNLGKVNTITYPGYKTLQYTYDELGKLIKVTNWLSQETKYQYDIAGRLERIQHSNGTVTSYTYNKNNQLLALENTKPDGTGINSYSYKLDERGNRVAVDKTEPQALQMTAGVTDYQYNPQRNRLQSMNGSVFGYDNEGQQSSAYGNTYSFDYNHRLTGITGSSPTQYVYDAMGNRVQATRNGVVTKYIYDPAGNLIAQANASNQITQYYVYGAGLESVVTSTNQTYVYHFDGIGNTIAITDSNRNISNSYAYTPYGLIANQTEVVTQPFKYVGQYGVLAEANNYYYMRARYYDAAIGRFIKEDPIGYDGGLNLYGYVSGNPIMLADPSGLTSLFFNDHILNMVGAGILHLGPGINSEVEHRAVDHLFYGNGQSFNLTFDESIRYQSNSQQPNLYGSQEFDFIIGSRNPETPGSIDNYNFNWGNRPLLPEFATRMASAIEFMFGGAAFDIYLAPNCGVKC